jgi:hypothetical protein
MNQNKLTFESEGLVVDYISFNIEGLVDKTELERIANYLFQNFGFNSTFAVGLDGKEEILFDYPKNKYHIYFRAYRYCDIYWQGIKIDFSGNNGNQLYNLIVANEINWEKFNHEKGIQLCRIDLCYVHNKPNNNTSAQSFLKQCYEKVVQNNVIRNFSLQKNSSSLILKIGKRGSPNYYRVYEKNTEIRFELEQRGTKIKALQKLILKHHIKEFEQIMTENFFKYTKKVLVIDENYTDWLIDYLRRQNKPKESLSLVTGYFNQSSYNLINTDEKKKFFRFLQFITFSHSQPTYTKTFWGQPYSIVQFKITDFMDFIQIPNKNQYQREQLIQFLEELQTMKPFVKIYTNESFQSFTVFPAVKIRKEFGEYGPWIVKIAILKELHLYSYRFFFPTYFLTYQNNLELQTKLHFIQSYSSQNLKKTFYSNQILEKYKLANSQKKAQLKQLIQYLFQQALKYKIIQKDCQIEFKNKKIQFIQIQQLTPLLIGQIEIINFYERVF